MAIRRIIAHGGSFNSELGEPDADNNSILKLIVNFHLFQLNPPGGHSTGVFLDDGTNYHYQAWDPVGTEWTDFCERFDDACEQIWCHRLFLSPPTTLPNLAELRAPGNDASSPFPCIICDLDVQVVTNLSDSHCTIGCYYLSPDEDEVFRSWVQPGTPRDHGRFCNRDFLSEARFEAGAYHDFQTLAHEVGHILGLQHPNCPGNQMICYGAPGTPGYDSIMGYGTGILPSFAEPWKQRLGQHIGHSTAEGWTVHTSHPNINPDEVLERLMNQAAPAAERVPHSPPQRGRTGPHAPP